MCARTMLVRVCSWEAVFTAPLGVVSGLKWKRTTLCLVNLYVSLNFELSTAVISLELLFLSTFIFFPISLLHLALMKFYTSCSPSLLIRTVKSWNHKQVFGELQIHCFTYQDEQPRSLRWKMMNLIDFWWFVPPPPQQKSHTIIIVTLIRIPTYGKHAIIIQRPSLESSVLQTCEKYQKNLHLTTGQRVGVGWHCFQSSIITLKLI